MQLKKIFRFARMPVTSHRFDDVFGNEHADQDDVNALGNERERNGRNRVNRNTILRRDDLANAEFSLVYGKAAEAHLERDENGKVIRKWIKHRSQKKLDFIDMTRINGQDEWDDTQGNAFIDVGVMDVDGDNFGDGMDEDGERVFVKGLKRIL